MPDDKSQTEPESPAAQSKQTPGQQLSAPDEAPPPNRLKKLVRPLVMLLLIALAGFLFWRFFLRKPDVPANIIQVTGRVEGDDAAISAKTAGRIREINVREGDQVKAGQIIAVLDDAQVKAREEAAQSAVEQSAARQQRAQQQIAFLRSQLEQAQLGVAQARTDAQGRVHQAEAQVAGAEAQLAQAEAAYSQARYDEEKFTKLAKQGDTPERTAMQAHTAADAQRAIVQAAHKQVDAARGALQATRAGLINPQIRAAQATGVEQQMAQAQTDIEAAAADIERARAQFREAEANRADLQIAAPFDGTVATRTAEPGEVVAAGTPIITIVNLDKVYLRAFVPEGEIGRVKPGQQARIYLDTAKGGGGRALEATVERIDPEASFTPENTYFREERVKQVVGVKLLLTNSQGAAKPGMPADGEILVEGNVWPLDTGRR